VLGSRTEARDPQPSLARSPSGVSDGNALASTMLRIWRRKRPTLSYRFDSSDDAPGLGRPTVIADKSDGRIPLVFRDGNPNQSQGASDICARLRLQV